MRAILCGLTFLSLAGCGVDETVYIPEYADNYCQTLVDCTDPAVLTFDGITSKDDCLSIIGPWVEGEVNRCSYRPKQAKKCLEAMELMGCPGPDQSVDDVIPMECDAVLTECGAAKEPGSTAGGTPTETGGSGA